MTPDSSHSVADRNDSFRSPESGMFERIREWNDVFPWFRLGRTLRLAGSPPLVVLTFLCLGVWWLGESIILGDAVPKQALRFASDEMVDPSIRPAETVVRLAYVTSPSSVYRLPGKAAAWRLLAGTIWTMLIWTPIGLLLTRQGGMLTAGRSMLSMRSALQLAFSRMPRAWLAALVPSACVAMIVLLLFVLGKAGSWVGGIVAIETAFAILLALIAIVCGLLVFGSYFAIPLAWAALSMEQNPDPLDSLSRGYEYLLRRPLHLTAYLILALVILLIVGAIASGVSTAASLVVGVALGSSEASQSLGQRVIVILRWFPIAVVVTLAWGLVGGVYLLLRCDAGGQEVEDVWVPPREPQPPLPSLPVP